MKFANCVHLIIENIKRKIKLVFIFFADSLGSLVPTWASNEPPRARQRAGEWNTGLRGVSCSLFLCWQNLLVSHLAVWGDLCALPFFPFRFAFPSFCHSSSKITGLRQSSMRLCVIAGNLTSLKWLVLCWTNKQGELRGLSRAACACAAQDQPLTSFICPAEY